MPPGPAQHHGVVPAQGRAQLKALPLPLHNWPHVLVQNTWELDLWINCLIHLCTCAYSKEATVNHKAIETLAGSGKSKDPAGGLGEPGVHSLLLFVPIQYTKPIHRGGTASLALLCSAPTRESCQPKQQQVQELPPACCRGGRENPELGNASALPRSTLLLSLNTRVSP